MRDIGGFPISELAMPMIRPDEAAGADRALCPWHSVKFIHLNQEGKVYYCPAGAMFWRYSKRTNGFHAQLRFPRNL